MSKNYSLKQTDEFISENIEKIAKVRRELEEIQIGFNSAYVEWKAKHDAALERLTETVTGRWEEVGAGLRAEIETRIAQEQRLISKRRQVLRDELLPEAQSEADQILNDGQQLKQTLRELNPQLDQREEDLKAARAKLEHDLKELNEQIRRLSGCLQVVFNFFKINKLDRQRQRLIGKLESIQDDLKKVRGEWEDAQVRTMVEEETLQLNWQDLTLKLAELQGEADYVDDQTNREALALRRASRYVIDNLKEPVDSPAADIKQELDAMVTLNIQTDTYQKGLGSVSSLMSVLDGVTEGMKRFGESVSGLISEQRMHSAYLPTLRISVPDDVLGFHAQWDGLAQKVRDDRHLSAQPAEFVAAVLPSTQQHLSESSIKRMFESLGSALKSATQAWRG